MIRYVPSSAADALSRSLWTLADPEPTRGTTAMFPTVRALDDSLWLQVETTFSVPVHPGALPDGLLPTTILLILARYIDAGQLPITADDDLTDLVAAHLGQRMNVWSAFPQLFKDMSKTNEEMITAGLLAAPQTP